MEKNYFIQINEKPRSIMLRPCNAFEAIRLLNFYEGGINLLKEPQEVAIRDWRTIAGTNFNLSNLI